MIRFGGYLGLVLLLAGIALQILQPEPQRPAVASLHGYAVGATAVGYALVLLRLGDVAATSNRRAERILARFAIGSMTAGISFIGIGLLLSNPGPA